MVLPSQSLMPLAKVRSLPYPQNLLIDIGITYYDTVPYDFDKLLASLLCRKAPRELDILLSLYRDKRSATDVAACYKVSYQRVRELRARIVRFLSITENKAVLQIAIAKSNNVSSASKLWLQAVASRAERVSAEDAKLLVPHLKSLGVIFPEGILGERLAKLISPALAQGIPLRNGVSVATLVSVDNLGLSSKLANCLKRNKIFSLWGLLTCSGAKLAALNGVGEKYRDEIIDCLRKIGLNVDHLGNKNKRSTPYKKPGGVYLLVS